MVGILFDRAIRGMAGGFKAGDNFDDYCECE